MRIESRVWDCADFVEVANEAVPLHRRRATTEGVKRGVVRRKQEIGIAVGESIQCEGDASSEVQRRIVHGQNDICKIVVRS